MLKIGEALSNFDTDLLDCFNSQVVQVSNYTNKKVVISFIDIKNGWDWLKQFVLLKQNAVFDANTQFIALVFNSAGAVTKNGVKQKINNELAVDPLYYNSFPWNNDTDNFVIVADNEGLVSGVYDKNTAIYLACIKQDVEGGFHNTALTTQRMLTYVATWNSSALTTSICDKWHNECITKDDPLSLRHMDLAVGAFDPNNYPVAKAYLEERLLNLLADPRVLYTVPATGEVVTESDLANVSVVFSTPVNISSVTDISNYLLAGSGATNLAINNLIYEYADQVVNRAKLSIGLATGQTELSPGMLDINLNPVANPATQIRGLDNSALEGNNGNTYYTVEYETETTPPRVVGVRVNP